jgi:uncharacterized protein YraI
VLIRFVILAVVFTSFVAGCDTVSVEQEGLPTATPGFVTATLPPTPSPAPTQTPLPPTPIPTLPPVDGRTTTQVNVRADTSSASESLGVIPAFTAVQVIGVDESGNWYQIAYPDSVAGTGWVHAEFVQVDASAEITVIRPGAGEGSGVSGVILERINVRSGAGRTFEALGILNPGDAVSATGMDVGGGWIQIEFANVPDGIGWVAAEFIEVEDIELLPVIGGEETVEKGETTHSPAIQPAMQDDDSRESPLVQVTLEPSGARAFQFSGEVSAPDGDSEDWIGFRTDSGKVVIEVQCSSNSLRVELWNNGGMTNAVPLPCGERRVLSVSPNSNYYLRIHEQGGEGFRRTRYTIKIERINH